MCFENNENVEVTANVETMEWNDKKLGNDEVGEMIKKDWLVRDALTLRYHSDHSK